MRYGKIDVVRRTTTLIEHDTFLAAKRDCGLAKVDFATLLHVHGVGGIQIAVDGYGMFEPPDQQHYFAIGTQLFAGPALLLAYNARGEPIDLDDAQLELDELRYFANAEAVENAIASGDIERPVISCNNEPFWQWPSPRPDFEALTRMAAASE